MLSRLWFKLDCESVKVKVQGCGVSRTFCCFPGKCFGITTPRSLLSHSDRIFTVCKTTGQISSWKLFCLIKNIFIKKNLTDFRKMVEIAVDSHLLDNPNSIPRLSLSRFSRPLTSEEQHSPT